MTEDGRRESVALELATADEELRAADQLLAIGLARIALTRAYFAAFHAARAMLYSEDLAPRTHTGLHHLVNLHLVRTGRLPAATSRLMARLQKFREEADYAEAFVSDEEGVREEVAAARALVDNIKAILAAS